MNRDNINEEINDIVQQVSDIEKQFGLEHIENKEIKGTLKYTGQLEIDQERGVIYFHSEHGITLLRICGLNTPIPEPLKIRYSETLKLNNVIDSELLDITLTDKRLTINAPAKICYMNWTQK